MADASVTYEFTNGTDAEAPEVNQNFTDILTFINDETIQRDGSTVMTANFPFSDADPTPKGRLGTPHERTADANAIFTSSASGTLFTVAGVTTTALRRIRLEVTVNLKCDVASLDFELTFNSVDSTPTTTPLFRRRFASHATAGNTLSYTMAYEFVPGALTRTYTVSGIGKTSGGGGTWDIRADTDAVYSSGASHFGPVQFTVRDVGI